MEYLNEMGLQLTTYHLYMFYMVARLDDEEFLGWTMVGTICAIFVVNLIVMTVLSILTIKERLHRRKLRKTKEKAIKEMKERQEQRKSILEAK